MQLMQTLFCPKVKIGLFFVPVSCKIRVIHHEKPLKNGRTIPEVRFACFFYQSKCRSCFGVGFDRAGFKVDC